MDAVAAAREACVQEAAALAEAAKAAITPVLPSTPVDTSVNAGKTVWYISGTFRDERSKQIAAGFEAAGAATNVEVRVIDGEGDVQNWNLVIEQAVAAGVDGIHIQGIDPDLVSQAVQEADDAGIPVTMGSALPSPSSPLLHGTEINVSGDMKADSKVVTDFILAESGCQGTFIMLATTLFSLGIAGIEGVEEELARLCPDDCKLVVEEVDFSNLNATIPPQIAALAQRNPEAVWFIAQFDVLALPMMLGLEDAGLAEGKKLIGHDGAFANLDLLRSGDSMQVADMAWSPAPVQGWRMMDAMHRALAGVEIDMTGAALPSQLFVRDNLAPQNDFELLFPGMVGFEQAYLTLWGVS
jgi:ribose transport system substrate-binding protein